MTRAGQTLIFYYDSLNRLTRKVVPGTTVHTKDPHLGCVLTGALAYARFNSLSGQGYAFNYDGLGQLEAVTSNLDDVTRTIAYEYDDAGRRSRITHPDGKNWRYTYDTLGRLDYIFDANNAAANWAQFRNDGLQNRLNHSPCCRSPTCTNCSFIASYSLAVAHDETCFFSDEQFFNEAKFMVKYLHSMIRVTDPDATVEFFNLIGLEEVRRFDVEAGRFTLIFLAAPGQEGVAEVELTYNWPPEDGSSTEKYDGGRNFGHLAYRVENIYETCQRLKDAGHTIHRPPRDGHMAFVKSPDGISVELLQDGNLPQQEPWASMENTGSW